MGNKLSGMQDSGIFTDDLKKLNTIVNDIINEKDIFKNKNYNFLAEDVCKNYTIVLQDELNKHLKLDIKTLGTSLYVLPKMEDDDTKLTNYKITKKEVCEKISNHYIKILYIMCLIKYVYNLEKNGDLSISGIIFRNIKIIDNMMQIYFCGLPHKRYTGNLSEEESYKINFSDLEGMQFFCDYFLNPEESQTFIAILRSVLARSKPYKIKQKMCQYINTHGVNDLKVLESLYESKFSNLKFGKCQQGGNNLYLFIQKDNPVFLSDYCGAPLKLVVNLNTVEGKEILGYYKQMISKYRKNINDIHKILIKLTIKVNGKYELNDIDKNELDNLISEIKITIKKMYIESIFDFQNLLDLAKKTPKIHIT